MDRDQLIGSHVPTLSVPLEGGQQRMRELILYIAKKFRDAPHFGVIKLNKVLWRSDFRSFAARQRPVTGREYVRLPHGPAPREMPEIQREMRLAGLIDIETTETIDGKVEHRTVPLAEPDTSLFSSEDMDFVDDSIGHYRDMTGAETSDDSHGLAWRCRNNGDPMPYELAMISDAPLGRRQLQRLRAMVYREKWTSL